MRIILRGVLLFFIGTYQIFRNDMSCRDMYQAFLLCGHRGVDCVFVEICQVCFVYYSTNFPSGFGLQSFCNS
jgi:hypothetical protein